MFLHHAASEEAMILLLSKTQNSIAFKITEKIFFITRFTTILKIEVVSLYFLKFLKKEIQKILTFRHLILMFKDQ